MDYQHPSRTHWVGVSCLALLMLAALPLLAQQQAPPAGLPPQAQDAFDRGMAAVEQQQWDLAIRYFDEAQKATYETPPAPILLNLGLAHAKAGHEIQAIAWLQAYLSSQPAAPNADAVRKEIKRLEIATEAKMNKIFQNVIGLAEQLTHRDERSRALRDVASFQAMAGDWNNSLRTVALAEDLNNPVVRDGNRRDYALALCRLGEVDGAFNSLSAQETANADFDWESLSTCLFQEQDDFERARMAAERIQRAEVRARALKYLEEARANRHQKPRPVQLFDWLYKARELSKDRPSEGYFVDLDASLKAAQSARPSKMAVALVGEETELFARVQAVADVGRRLGVQLVLLRGLERKQVRQQQHSASP